jgi:hypothetical protein
MKKPAVVLSAILTTFILLTLAGVVYSARHTRAAEKVSSPPPEAVASPALDSELAQILDGREVAYRSLVGEANARLQQAQEEINRLEDQLNETQASGEQAAQSGQVLAPGVSLEQAAQIAAGYLGQSEVYLAESVTDGNGVAVYKVTFSSGDVVYVSPAGAVVSAQLASQVSGNQGSSGDWEDDDDDEHEDHDEHEEHEDDDD